MNTAECKIADRIYAIKEWLLKNDKQYNNSKINETRVKYQVELKNLEKQHHEDPFVVVLAKERKENE